MPASIKFCGIAGVNYRAYHLIFDSISKDLACLLQQVETMSGVMLCCSEPLHPVRGIHSEGGKRQSC